MQPKSQHIYYALFAEIIFPFFPLAFAQLLSNSNVQQALVHGKNCIEFGFVIGSLGTNSVLDSM